MHSIEKYCLFSVLALFLGLSGTLTKIFNFYFENICNSIRTQRKMTYFCEDSGYIQLLLLRSWVSHTFHHFLWWNKSLFIDTEPEIRAVCRLISDWLFTNQLHTYIQLKLVWIILVEVLVEVLTDEQSEWVKVWDEWQVGLTTSFKLTTIVFWKSKPFLHFLLVLQWGIATRMRKAGNYYNDIY